MASYADNINPAKGDPPECIGGLLKCDAVTGVQSNRHPRGLREIKKTFPSVSREPRNLYMTKDVSRSVSTSDTAGSRRHSDSEYLTSTRVKLNALTGGEGGLSIFEEGIQPLTENDHVVTMNASVPVDNSENKNSNSYRGESHNAKNIGDGLQNTAAEENSGSSSSNGNVDGRSRGKDASDGDSIQVANVIDLQKKRGRKPKGLCVEVCEHKKPRRMKTKTERKIDEIHCEGSALTDHHIRDLTIVKDFCVNFHLCVPIVHGSEGNSTRTCGCGFTNINKE
uniref:Uncharacterized protein n=1 Tax=Melicertus latisulcatus pemonivirus TaxID=2984278 RepID=A0A9C7C679_9VIRU|nr:MAG: hypothetical protein [Melicertus latisulcatus pemonivirus]